MMPQESNAGGTALARSPVLLRRRPSALGSQLVVGGVLVQQVSIDIELIPGVDVGAIGILVDAVETCRHDGIHQIATAVAEALGCP